MHFPLFQYLISLQLILITIYSPLSKVKQLRWHLCLDGCPLDSFTQLKLNFRRSHSGRTMAAASPVFFPRIFSQYSPSGGTLAAASPRTVAAAATVQLLTTWRNNIVPPLCKFRKAEFPLSIPYSSKDCTMAAGWPRRSIKRAGNLSTISTKKKC